MSTFLNNDRKPVCFRNLKGTLYHPQSNGQVDRFHRQLKVSLKARNTIYRSEGLPILLWGFTMTLNILQQSWNLDKCETIREILEEQLRNNMQNFVST